jgi:hypothetical protein
MVLLPLLDFFLERHSSIELGVFDRRRHRPKAEPQEPEVARTLWGGIAAEWFSLVPNRNQSAKFIA